MFLKQIFLFPGKKKPVIKSEKNSTSLQRYLRWGNLYTTDSVINIVRTPGRFYSHQL